MGNYYSGTKCCYRFYFDQSLLILIINVGEGVK